MRDREWSGDGEERGRGKERRVGGRVGVEKGKWAASHVPFSEAFAKLLHGNDPEGRSIDDRAFRSANGR